MRVFDDGTVGYSSHSTPERPSRPGRRKRAREGAPQRHPLAVDVSSNASIELPGSVAREGADAAAVLARVNSTPYSSVPS
ncbi:hypothetical protein [Phytomonospora endophytica]|uniref:Uncharacterized protein n=1 Tax=Phytomonospora endophytica TaxID=714109 RepID=A0A841G7F4_9ACTN|nr:hypothetical protein [Phytomonospora endophytica]MBB6040000.1 hypothetical protein [Phytomonospora endophytica]